MQWRTDSTVVPVPAASVSMLRSSLMELRKGGDNMGTRNTEF